MKTVSVWSRSRLFLSGARARADPIWSEPESAPGPRTAGAATFLVSLGRGSFSFPGKLKGVHRSLAVKDLF